MLPAGAAGAAGRVGKGEWGSGGYVPDERECEDAGQRDGELEVSPVADEERQQGEQHPSDRPEQPERCTGERAIHGREQLARHHDTHQARALTTHSIISIITIIYVFV